MASPLLNYIKQETNTFVDLKMLKMQRRVVKMHMSLVVSSPFLHKSSPSLTIDRTDEMTDCGENVAEFRTLAEYLTIHTYAKSP